MSDCDNFTRTEHVRLWQLYQYVACQIVTMVPVGSMWDCDYIVSVRSMLDCDNGTST